MSHTTAPVAGLHELRGVLELAQHAQSDLSTFLAGLDDETLVSVAAAAEVVAAAVGRVELNRRFHQMWVSCSRSVPVPDGDLVPEQAASGIADAVGPEATDTMAPVAAAANVWPEAPEHEDRAAHAGRDPGHGVQADPAEGVSGA